MDLLNVTSIMHGKHNTNANAFISNIHLCLWLGSYNCHLLSRYAWL